MEKVIVFGTGKRLEYLLEYSSFLKEKEIIAFCDNDVKKQGLLFNGIKIIHPNELMKYRECEYDSIYISSLKFFNEIKLQLMNDYKVPEEKIRDYMFYEGKYYGEFNYWRERFQEEGGRFLNSHYKEMMLNLAEEVDDKFMEGKVVADFGCGPRGSLAWTERPSIKLGIDILASKYWDYFGTELVKHKMLYITSSEKTIPLPDSCVDYLYTINSLDHVYNLEDMACELMRVLKPGGVFLAYFNLNEPRTDTEPQMLTEKLIKNLFEKYIKIISYRLEYPDGRKNYVDPGMNHFSNVDGNAECKLLLKGEKTDLL